MAVVTPPVNADSNGFTRNNSPPLAASNTRTTDADPAPGPTAWMRRSGVALGLFGPRADGLNGPASAAGSWRPAVDELTVTLVLLVPLDPRKFALVGVVSGFCGFGVGG